MSNCLVESKKLYATHLEAEFGVPKGASIGEIKQLEEALKFRAPRCYKEFLLWFGKDRDGLFRGSNVFLWDVEENWLTAKELIALNNVDIDLTGKVVFISHQGYFIGWFDASRAEDDPDCMFYSEGGGEITTRKFSTFVQDEVESAIARRVSV